MPLVGIVRMPIGNLQSLCNAVCELGLDPIIVDETSGFDDVTHLMVPGVGNFRAIMRNLEDRHLADLIRGFASSQRPLLGICVGMQLLASEGTEGGVTRGLGLVPGSVTRLSESKETRLPHVGWNTLTMKRAHPIFDGVKVNRDFYFVHSYTFEPDDGADVIGQTEYGRVFASAVARGNVVGLQFHPEKSQVNGLKLLENFCEWDGKC